MQFYQNRRVRTHAECKKLHSIKRAKERLPMLYSEFKALMRRGKAQKIHKIYSGLQWVRAIHTTGEFVYGLWDNRDKVFVTFITYEMMIDTTSIPRYVVEKEKVLQKISYYLVESKRAYTKLSDTITTLFRTQTLEELSTSYSFLIDGESIKNKKENFDGQSKPEETEETEAQDLRIQVPSS